MKYQICQYKEKSNWGYRITTFALNVLDLESILDLGINSCRNIRRDAALLLGLTEDFQGSMDKPLILETAVNDLIWE